MNRVPVILLCDDDEDEYILIRDAFQQVDRSVKIVFVHDGIELMEYLESCAHDPASEKPWPDIIWLDLNMPRMDGLHTLKWIKSSPHLQEIPVLIYTTSKENRDIQASYCCGANSFMSKCASFDDLVEKVRQFSENWIEAINLQDKK